MAVVNLHDKLPLKHASQDAWPDKYVYVGRPGKGLKSEFGNPIRIKETCPVCGGKHLTGGTTLACYEEWLRKKIEEDEAFREKVASLHGKTLVCFCKPKPCHGDILEKIAAELAGEEQ